jgi:hypothetical protein
MGLLAANAAKRAGRDAAEDCPGSKRLKVVGGLVVERGKKESGKSNSQGNQDR